jgi:hypothetical protein
MKATGDEGVPYDSAEMARIIERDFWDLGELIMSLGVLTDFEGFTGIGKAEEVMQTEPVQEVLDLYCGAGGGLKNVPRDMLRDFAIHWYHENMDQGGYEPSAAETVLFVHSIGFLLQSRWWMKSGSNA